MSIAVLRYFVEQRKRELEAGTFKNRKGRLAAATVIEAAKAAADGADANVAPSQLVPAGRSSALNARPICNCVPCSTCGLC